MSESSEHARIITLTVYLCLFDFADGLAPSFLSSFVPSFLRSFIHRTRL